MVGRGAGTNIRLCLHKASFVEIAAFEAVGEENGHGRILSMTGRNNDLEPVLKGRHWARTPPLAARIPSIKV